MTSILILFFVLVLIFIIIGIPCYLPIFYRELRNSWISEPVECEVIECKILPAIIGKRVFIRHKAYVDGQVVESQLTGATMAPFLTLKQEDSLYLNKFVPQSTHPGYWDRARSELYIEFRKYDSFDKLSSLFFFIASVIIWGFVIVYGIYLGSYLTFI